MTGFNHLPSCTCGWCLNYGRTRLNARQLASDFDRSRAVTFLTKNSARSSAGCFVNPNAKCPVCHAAVFFYSNQHGSKVYFDELGPPWSKHPCTDNPKNKSIAAPNSLIPPTRRARGITMELLDASYRAGLSVSSKLGRRAIGDWQLMIVVEADRTGSVTRVVAEYLNSDDQERMVFTCQSDAPVFEVGDFLSSHATQISFLDRETLRPVVFVMGGRVPEPLPDTVKPQAVQTQLMDSWGVVGLIRGPQEPELTEAEMVHFHSDKISVRQMCDKFAPILRGMSGKRGKRPADISRRLNAARYKTANGAMWTPRLAFFLLKLIREDKGPAPAQPQRKPHTKGRPPASANKALPLTRETMAAKLSSLGRVVPRKA